MLSKINGRFGLPADLEVGRRKGLLRAQSSNEVVIPKMENSAYDDLNR